MTSPLSALDRRDIVLMHLRGEVSLADAAIKAGIAKAEFNEWVSGSMRAIKDFLKDRASTGAPLRDLVEGVTAAIERAEAAWALLEASGTLVPHLEETIYKHLVIELQPFFLERMLLEIAKLYEIGRKDEVCSLFSACAALERDVKAIPPQGFVKRWPYTEGALREIGIDPAATTALSDAELTDLILAYFNPAVQAAHQQNVLDRIRIGRNGIIAHSSAQAIGTLQFARADLVPLIELAKRFVGVVGTIYLASPWIHSGRNHVAAEADDAASRLIELFKDAGIGEFSATDEKQVRARRRFMDERRNERLLESGGDEAASDPLGIAGADTDARKGNRSGPCG